MSRRKRNVINIELDITQRCDKMCNNCTRRCDLFKGEGIDVSPSSIEDFVKETVDAGHTWSKIFIMGGEPTLHPELQSIAEILMEYKNKHVPGCRVHLVSNCATKHARDMVEKMLSIGLEVRRSEKTDKLVSKFWTMNVAPIDFSEFKGANYGDGCGQQLVCGLQRYVDDKYYGCAMAGGIERVFNLGIGIDSLSEILNDGIRRWQFEQVCGLCGRWRIRYVRKSNGAGVREIDFDPPEIRNIFDKHCEQYPTESSRRFLSETWKRKLEESGLCCT